MCQELDLAWNERDMQYAAQSLFAKRQFDEACDAMPRYRAMTPELPEVVAISDL
jgi:hypothetical protein